MRRCTHHPTGEECVIAHFQYLGLMAACLLVTLPLEFVVGARVYRRPGSLLRAIVPVVVVFSIWDVAGIVAGHWTYNPQYVTGVQLVWGMPLEELVFFVVVPICGLLTYEAVGIVLGRLRRSGPPPTSGR
jgi:lycopene cyclase domain-containing protein